jgi:hypothetical protein
MDETVKYNVYSNDGKLVASYDSQAPATSMARTWSRHRDEVYEVVEERYAHVSSRAVRKCIGGVIFPCS